MVGNQNTAILGRVDELFVAPIEPKVSIHRFAPTQPDGFYTWFIPNCQVRNLGYERISPNSSTEPNLIVDMGDGNVRLRKLKRLFRKKRYRVVLNYLTLGIIALMLAALYANPFRFAWREWFAAGSYYSHAPLIPIISGFLIWRKRGDFPYIAVNYSMLGFAFLVPGFLLRLLGDVWGSNSISLLSLPCFLTGIALFLFGRKMTRTVLFPLCFLLFMVTIPASLLDVLTFNMKLFAARLSAGPMQLLAYPLIREGNVIHMTQSTVGVEDACSGLGSLISLLALSTLCAYLVRASYPRRILLVLAAVPIAIIANVFRIIGTCLVANSFGAGIATHEVVHIAFGMMVFIIALGILILIGRAIKCRFSIGDVW